MKSYVKGGGAIYDPGRKEKAEEDYKLLRKIFGDVRAHFERGCCLERLMDRMEDVFTEVSWISSSPVTR